MSPAFWYGVAIGVALIFIWGAKIDRDPGPAKGTSYPMWDRWSLWHLVGSLLLAFIAVTIGVSPVWALLLTVVAGIGWEYVNGYVDWWDVVWDGVGAVGGMVIGVLVRV